MTTRYFNSSRGYIYTLEVLLAIATIFVTLVLVFSNAPEQPEAHLAVIKQSGYDALFYMDQSGELRDAVSRGSVTAINSNLTATMPATILFSTAICTTSCQPSSLPANRTIVIVDYYTGDYRDQYIGKKVRLWMWEKF